MFIGRRYESLIFIKERPSPFAFGEKTHTSGMHNTRVHRNQFTIIQAGIDKFKQDKKIVPHHLRYLLYSIVCQ